MYFAEGRADAPSEPQHLWLPLKGHVFIDGVASYKETITATHLKSFPWAPAGLLQMMDSGMQ